MDLILWRHAEAEGGLPDASRNLTAAGAEEARRMAAWLRPRVPDDVAILVSPAARAQQTAQAFIPHFETTPAVGTAASPGELLAAAGWPGATGTVLVVGHQATLGQAAALLMSGKPAYWSVRKGAVWWFRASERDGGYEVRLRAVVAPDAV